MVAGDKVLRDAENYLCVIEILKESNDEESKLLTHFLDILHEKNIVWYLTEIGYEYYKQGFITKEEITKGVLKTFKFIRERFKNRMLTDNEIKPDVLAAVMGPFFND